MRKPLLGQKIAVLVANGFSEQDLTVIQRALMEAGATLRVIGMDHGLVNSWNGDGWGLNFASDQALSEALAVDYDMLLVPGGQRSVEKLKLTAHTRRFINGFLNSDKPCALFEDAVSLLAFANSAGERDVVGPQNIRGELEAAGAQYGEEGCVQSGSLITGRSNDETRAAYVDAVFTFFTNAGTVEAVKEAVAA